MRKKLETKKKPKENDGTGKALGVKKSSLKKIAKIVIDAMNEKETKSEIIKVIWDSDLKDNEVAYALFSFGSYTEHQENSSLEQIFAGLKGAIQ